MRVCDKVVKFQTLCCSLVENWNREEDAWPAKKTPRKAIMNASNSTSSRESNRQPYLAEMVSKTRHIGTESRFKAYQKPRAMNQYSTACIIANQIMSWPSGDFDSETARSNSAPYCTNTGFSTPKRGDCSNRDDSFGGDGGAG